MYDGFNPKKTWGGGLFYIFHSHSLTIIDMGPIFIVAVGQHVMAIITEY